MPLTLFSGQGPSRPVAVAPPVGRQVAASGMDATSEQPSDNCHSSSAHSVWGGCVGVRRSSQQWPQGFWAASRPVWAFILYLEKVGDGERQYL